MKKKKLLLLTLLIPATLAFGQKREVEGMKYLNEQRRSQFRESLVVPDVNAYRVLKCDFHTHTVFSDGRVWPTIRNQEVWEEGLDAYAITDHIEYHPFKEDVKVDHNRGYELLQDLAKKQNLILVKGSEITRLTPPGHFNAIFIEDASGFIAERADNQFDREAVMKAAEQNAFIFWNHPGWQPGIEGSYEWLDFIEDLYVNKALHGIEVVNGFGVHLKALDWCIDKGLTVMGSSDIHNLVAYEYDLNKREVHRTMTLVLAKERTPESLREALESGRTVAWAGKYLLGKEEHVRSLFDAAVELAPSHYTEVRPNGKATHYHQITNHSDLYFELELREGSGTGRIVLHPRSSQLISVADGTTSLTYEAVTTYIRSDRHLSVTFGL
ncbi:MAG: Sb-PDE family phosphodiesterase [bacterium]|nr:Sb-PDE family phosphodiesterase [bacterium]MDD3624813.1 Sb-PDE family phosphodiesterase [Proteiniphilum sp.]MDD3967870.1 Sb-PDE family phosphodiesterase [Proteiniphilum sp.]